MRRSSSLTILWCRMIAPDTVDPWLPRWPNIPFRFPMAHRTLKPMTGTTSGAQAEVWEGSAKGIAYSERNHHVAGFMVLLMGIAELSHVLRLSSLRWARLLLPSILVVAGLLIIVWSDHEAWPIGSLSFLKLSLVETPKFCSISCTGFWPWGWEASSCSAG